MGSVRNYRWIGWALTALESAEDFVKARRQHAAVEPAINALEVHGLNRCPDHGVSGFKRYVALAVVARNIHCVGAILREQENRRAKRKSRYADRDRPHKLAA
jgi:transposase, IS5 family